MAKETYCLDKEISKLFNPKCDEPIVLLANEKIPTRFKKIALVTHKSSLFAILTPIDKIPGIKDGESLVLEITKNNVDELSFVLPKNEKTENKIRKIYEKKQKLNELEQV